MTTERWLSLDTETTGLNVDDGDRVIEIGIIEFKGLAPTGRVIDMRINPEGRDIPYEAQKVHGITNEMVANERTFAQIADELLDFIGDDPIHAYNASFDMGFVNGELERINYAPLANPVVDIMEVAKKRYPRKKASLDAVAKRLGIDLTRRTKHGALLDADIAAQVYCRLVEQDELVMAAVESAVVAPTSAPVERLPVLNAPGERLGAAVPHIVTTYSLLDSALMPDKACKAAKKMGYDSIGMADRFTTAGALEFAAAAKKEEIKPIVGVELSLQNSGGKCIALYAMNAAGWENIQALVTLHNVERFDFDAKPQRSKGLTSADLKEHAEGVACLGGGSDGAIAHILINHGADAALKTARFLAAIYPKSFAIEISRHAGRRNDIVEAGLLAIAHGLGVPTVATSIARAVPGESSLVQIIRALEEKAEYHPEDNNSEMLRSPQETMDLFSDMPEAVLNAVWFAGLCDYAPTGTKPMLPRYDTGDETESEALDRIARAGLAEHLKAVPEHRHADYLARYDYEYGLIDRQGFSGYFLIVADFINWAKDNDIPVGPGRGSGAGSLVAWCMGITGLDPLRFNLLFERFINPDRVSLPDFDVDFCEDRREEVIAYARRKYGDDKVVAIATYGRFKTKMAVKDAGRVMGLPYGLTDRISKELDSKDELTREVLNKPEIRQLITTADAREALDIALKLGGLVRNKGKHAAGIVISDRTVSRVAALDRDPKKPDQLMTQYDMKIVEKSGLVKFDFLGLSTLTAVHYACQLLKEKGIAIDPWTLPLEDKATYDTFMAGHMIGIFQMESGGMTRAAREVRINTFEDIVAMVALYRPGPMDNIPLYARRKKGLEPFGTPHPLLDEVAKDTYGILIYQEQVMQAAQVLAGYTLGGADLLRRAMGKKIQSEMDAQRETFVKGCWDVNQIPPEQANALFDMIDKFAGYGFNRSHAAAYALIAYVTAYLKTHHPSEYLAATMEINRDKTDEILKYAQEARRLGIEFVPPAITSRSRRFTVDDEGRIVWSLTAIRGIGPGLVSALVGEQEKAPYANFRDMVDRVGEHLNRATMTQLAAAGVVDGMFPDRRSALLAVRHTYEAVANEAKARRAGQGGLFDDHVEGQGVASDEEEIDDKEILTLERSALGLTLSAHPLDAHLPRLATVGILPPHKAEELLDHMPVTVAAMIDEVKMGKGRGAWVGVRISDERTSMAVGCGNDLPGLEHLQVGALLILRLSAYVTSGERRTRIDEIVGPVESDPGGVTIRMDVRADFRRDDLRKALKDAAPGTARLVVIPPEGAWMTTPPILQDDAATIALLTAVEGVERVASTKRVA